MKEPTSYLLNELLKLNSIKVDKKELEFQFESHPSYPSLHSITGVLAHFNIENLAIEVPNDIEILLQLPKFFIAYITDEKGKRFVLAIQANEHIEIVYDKKSRANLTNEAFLQVWSGIIVAVEKTENYQKSLESHSLPKYILYISTLSLLFIFFQSNITWFKAVHFLVSILGATISIIIVQHELGKYSVILDKFCSRNNEKTSCDDVLKSKGATLIGNIKLSDVGLIYFFGIILSWLLLSLIINASDNIIVLLSIAAVPFTFYSLIYQRFVVKKWCPLCLSVLAIIWIHGASLFLYNQKIKYATDLNSLLAVTLGFIVVFLIWFFIYPKLKTEQEHKKLQITYNRFKNKYSVFDALISRNSAIDTKLGMAPEIILGKKDEKPALEIVLITNPLCGHCKSAHQAVEPLLKSRKKTIRVVIRFNVNTRNGSDQDVLIAARLLAIYHKREESTFIEALDEIYSDASPQNWLMKWNIEEKDEYFELLNNEKEWCQANNINFTPEILLNGRAFPKEYGRNDLQYFIDDLIEKELKRL